MAVQFQTMTEHTLILPNFDNDNTDLALEQDAILQELVTIASGYSATRQSGAWESPDGTVFYDTSIRVVTVTDTSKDSLLQARLETWCDLLRQEALFYQTREIRTAFVAGRTSQKAA